MDLGLKDKVVLVTGGGRGLGRETALAFAAEGARVAVTYVSRPADAERVAQEVASRHGGKAVALRADLAVAEEIPAMFDRAERALGPVDVLVNNAGHWAKSDAPEGEAADWRRTLDVNLAGPCLACREAVRRWRSAGRRGCIVNVTSQAAYGGSRSGYAHYAAAKAGLANFTISLAREVAALGIRVNSVAPGFMRTEMVEAAVAKDPAGTLQRIPLGRIADPAEVAAAVVFMASERASYITGASLDVNGGMVMR